MPSSAPSALLSEQRHVRSGGIKASRLLYGIFVYYVVLSGMMLYDISFYRIALCCIIFYHFTFCGFIPRYIMLHYTVSFFVSDCILYIIEHLLQYNSITVKFYIIILQYRPLNHRMLKNSTLCYNLLYHTMMYIISSYLI